MSITIEDNYYPYQIIGSNGPFSIYKDKTEIMKVEDNKLKFPFAESVEFSGNFIRSEQMEIIGCELVFSVMFRKDRPL